MHIDDDGKISGMRDYYVDLFDTIARAPPNELVDDVRVWFAQFDKNTWESEEDFIVDFPELGISFGLLSNEATRNGLCSTFVILAFGVIAEGMLADLRILTSLGCYDAQTGLKNDLSDLT